MIQVNNNICLTHPEKNICYLVVDQILIFSCTTFNLMEKTPLFI